MNFRVKEICKEKGLTLEELAGKMEIARPNLTKMLGGNPTIGTLQKIADILKVPITELFDESDKTFTALIDYKGELHRFDSVDTLETFLTEIK